MMLFWTLALLMALAATAFVLLPIWPALWKASQQDPDRTRLNVELYREHLAELEQQLRQGEIDTETFHALDNEAKRDLLKDVGQTDKPAQGDNRMALLIATSLLVPTFAIVIYADWGLSRGAMTDHEMTAKLRTTAPDDPAYRQLVQALAARVDDMPNPGDARFLLASAHISLGEYRQAADIYHALTTEFPKDARLAAIYAETLFLAEDKRMTPKVKAAIQRAMQLTSNE